jgi:poly(A) polymerase
MIDDDALFVLRKLHSAGFSGYLVGGGVRDLYLGKSPKDFDISTDARPGQIRRLFTNSRTIGRRFRLVQVFFKKGKIIEVSTLRSLSEHDLDGPEAVLAPNNTYGTLDQDAQRRDISINGLFYEIENQTLIDYVNGVADLDRSVIRIIGDPDKRITRDPVRMMRVIRHAARNNFTIDTKSWQAVTRNSTHLPLCPPSRLRDEALKDIYSGVSYQWFELAVSSGIFTELFKIYRDILYHPLPNGLSCQQQLSQLFRTIDKYNNQSVVAGHHRQPDYFLLALILIPWATCHFDLINARYKGAQFFHFASQIRTALHETIGEQLNLKRSTRQDILNLLINLPTLIQHHHQGSWPKWLKRKSYFSQCSLLYYYFREAIESIPAPEPSLAASRLAPRRQSKTTHRTQNSRRKGRPAFTNTKSGGIFGFKR